MRYTEDRQREQARMWAIATEMFGHDEADMVIHVYIILNMGKTSVRHLTDEEVQDVANWLMLLSEAAS